MRKAGDFSKRAEQYKTTSYTVNQKYYVMGNYSKFIRPGYKIIGMSDANTLAAYDAASGKVVLVTTNSESTDTSVTYDLSRFSSVGSSVQVYRTSATEKLQQLTNIPVQNKSLQRRLKRTR